jgi:mRNA interferase RelE/StbE
LTYSIVWDEHAINAVAHFLKDDHEGLRQLFDSVDLLGSDPRPAGTVEYGSPDLRRMRVGRYRVLYEITEATATIVVIHVGRVG